MTIAKRSLVALVAAAALFACEDPPKKPNPFDPPADKPIQPPPSKEPPKPEGPPSLEIDSISPKVGFERENFKFPDGRQKLAAALQQNRQHFEGKEVQLIVDRKAEQTWVAAYLAELGNIGVTRVKIKSDTRSEFPHELFFTPEAKLSKSAPCSTVAMIMADRSTAVWKLSGGVAGRRGKGMAGPDLSMTGDTIERVAKACKTSQTLFVVGAPEIEWGLVYDLAASTKSLGDALFDTIGLLSITPVPGHKVDFPK
ncbi:MAG: hypothetical protein QM756_24385 [Polyangiaceae bacterium]